MSRQQPAERGAALVEYALVVALVATVGAIGLAAVGERAIGIVQRQAVCMSSRPAPPTCHVGGSVR
jgi:hypothetical protein